MDKPCYIVITPVRDECLHIERTINSMLMQTILPAEWIIVDDGSTDGTGQIIDKYVKEHHWIKSVHRENRGYRKNGGGVVEAFYDGLSVASSAKWDYIVKLDGDLSFDNNYFELCFQRFINDPKIGIGGGSIYNIINGKLEIEACPPFHVRGATKIYRKETWVNIGGIKPITGWDTIDELKANMLGWNTCSFLDIPLSQHKMTGSADGKWGNWVKNGKANYNTGYHPLFMIIKCLKRLTSKPYVLGGVGLFYGYIDSVFKNIEKVDDPSLISFVRKEQINRLLFRKSLWKY